MKKLIVCGDSYMSPAVRYPKTHFSEIIADKLGYELIAYSRAGMSNGGIAIQIDTAIRQQPDLILLGVTYADRIEFPINEPKKTERFTVEDLSYHHSSESLSSNVDFFEKNPQLISTNLVEIIANDYGNTFDKCDNPKVKKRAIQDWFKHVYHPDLKTQTDIWMMYAVLHQLHESKIPYIICRDTLNVIPKCPWLNGYTLNSDIIKLIDTEANYGINFPYHTSIETQANIAELLITYMKENFDV